jgi:predicted Zn finger-like uncharacterized protein
MPTASRWIAPYAASRVADTSARTVPPIQPTATTATTRRTGDLNMKIVCQNCSATYKIADDKVQGKKVFKIKCKKCGEDILVRGTDAPAEAEAPMERPSEDEQTRVVSNEGSEPIWHAVLNGDQQGPFTLDQLRDLMAQGQIDTETYVWRDGFDGWLPMRDVAELVTRLKTEAKVV